MVRGGAGFYYGPSTHMVAGAGQDSDGFSTSTLWNATCFNADGNTVYNGTSACVGAAPGSPAPSPTVPYSLSNPFPNGVVQVLSNPSGLANNLGNSLSTVLRSQRTPTTYNFNFGLEYEFPHSTVLSMGYVGSRGLFLPFGGVDLNQLDLGTIQRYGYSLCVDTSNPACKMAPNKWAAILPSTNGLFGATTVPLWDAVQPYPQFGDGSYGAGNGVNVHGYPAGDSDYSSLQTKLQKRLTQHFTALASFTWGKLITDDGNPPLGFVGAHLGGAQDWKNLNFEHSVSPQDIKYQFSGEASYDLPVGKGRGLKLNGVGDAILGGWTANGILYLSSGIPIASPTVGANVSYFNQRPNLACDPGKGAAHKPGSFDSSGNFIPGSGWFNSTCFVAPASPFVAGTAPAYLDHVRSMGADDVDLSIYKKFSLGEQRELRFDVSSYNVANRAQFGGPNVSSTATGYPDFGWIQGTVNSPRQFQFGARFSF